MSRESEFYLSNVPEVVGARLVHNAALAVRLAQIESRLYPDLELDAVPSFRRLMFQSLLLDATYPRGVKVTTEEHNGGSHVVIRSGLVAITSQTRSHMPRSVQLQPYQDTMAAEAQGVLFSTADVPTPASDRLWGLLIYGGHYRSTKLTLCRMTFPTPAGKFAPGTIDLLAAYPQVAEAFNDEEYVRKQVIAFQEVRKARLG